MQLIRSQFHAQQLCPGSDMSTEAGLWALVALLAVLVVILLALLLRAHRSNEAQSAAKSQPVDSQRGTASVTAGAPALGPEKVSTPPTVDADGLRRRNAGAEACLTSPPEVEKEVVPVVTNAAGPRSSSRLQPPSRQEAGPLPQEADLSEDGATRQASLERSGSTVPWGFAWNEPRAFAWQKDISCIGESCFKEAPLSAASMAHMSRTATNQRNYRKAMAEETLQILETGGYYSPETGDWVDLVEPLERCVEGSFVLHEGEDIVPAGGSQVPAGDRLVKVEDAGNIVLLNFASAKNPGGGFLGGAQAQEESLARSSGLYPCLTKFQDDMYAANRKDPRGGFYSDDMIFSSHVPFFRTDQGSLLPSPICCSVITCPAVNAGVVAEGACRQKGGTPVMQVMEGRLRRVLRLARARGAETLILGAWGCGVFRNTPEDVARLFRAALFSPKHGFDHGFARAVFAVPDEKMKSCFARILLPTAPGHAASSAFRWDVPAPQVLPGDSPLTTPTPTLRGYGLENPTSPELISCAVDPESPPDSPKSAQLVSDLDNDQPAQRALELKLISFGYSRGGGIPVADHVFDARHIKNPQKGPQKHLTGLDARLRKEIMANDGAEELYEKMVQVVLNDLAEERAPVVAVGCTHGKHRSVTFCEELAMKLRGKISPQGRRLAVEVWHRERGSWSKKGRWRRGVEGLGAWAEAGKYPEGNGGFKVAVPSRVMMMTNKFEEVRVAALAMKRLILAGVDPASPAGAWNTKRKDHPLDVERIFRDAMGQSSTTAGAVVWGSSEHGQLGIGSLPTEDRGFRWIRSLQNLDKAVAPRLVEGLRSVPVKQVASGGYFSAAVSESGELYCWGHGKDGQLGHGDLKDVHMPRAVRSLQSKVVRTVSCGEHHVGAVSEVGVLYTWGRGQNGRLGHGGQENELLPKPVEVLSGYPVGLVACGEFHTACILQNAPHVYTWGLGLSGRLGHGDENDRLTPTFVEALTGMQVSTMACGGHHTAAVGDHLQVMTWGGGAFGKLGHGNRLAQSTPKVVVALQGKRVIQVSLGPHHSAALTQKGEIYTWGQAGRLGHASQGAEEMLPRPVVALSHVCVAQVSCGHSHCCAVTDSGDVWAWGSSRTFGHTEQSAYPNVPTMIKVLAGKAIVHVACGVTLGQHLLTHNVALSDYRRLSKKGLNAPAPGGKKPRMDEERRNAAGDNKKEAEQFSKTPQTPQNLDEIRAPWEGSDGSPEKPKGHQAERPVAFLSSELKAYQEQTLRLAKLLQETRRPARACGFSSCLVDHNSPGRCGISPPCCRTKLETLQNENSFLKSELEVMHQCSNDADERLDTLRRHFNERIREPWEWRAWRGLEMERRYNDKERAWRDTFSRLRLHLGVGGGLEPPEEEEPPNEEPWEPMGIHGVFGKKCQMPHMSRQWRLQTPPPDLLEARCGLSHAVGVPQNLALMQVLLVHEDGCQPMQRGDEVVAVNEVTTYSEMRKELAVPALQVTLRLVVDATSAETSPNREALRRRREAASSKASSASGLGSNESSPMHITSPKSEDPVREVASVMFDPPTGFHEP
eukprot:s468_g17.t1